MKNIDGFVLCKCIAHARIVAEWALNKKTER